MKNNTLTIFALVLFALVGCQSERAELPTQGYGYAEFSCLALPEVRSQLPIVAPAEAEFSLRITGEEYDEQWDALSDYNVKENRLEQGLYKAVVSWGDMTQEGENLPTFAGESDFTILPLQTIPVPITARVSNSVVQVVFTENFLNYFHDEKAVLTTAAGNTFEFTSENSPQIFVAPGEFKINTSALKQTGEEFVLPEQKRTAVAQTLHVVKFDLSTAGTAQVEIYLNENLLEGITVDQELNPDSENM